MACARRSYTHTPVSILLVLSLPLSCIATVKQQTSSFSVLSLPQKPLVAEAR